MRLLSKAVPLVATALLALGCGGSSPVQPPPNHPDPDDPKLDSPRDVRASQDVASFVRLEWSVPPDAVPTSFVIERDGAPIAETDGASRGYDDAGATAGRVLAPKLEASQGAREDAVELTWDAAGTAAGPTHSYRVVAVYGDARSDASDPAEGRRAAPGSITLELQRDGAPISTPTAGDHAFEDPQAEPGQRTAPAVKGTSLPEGARLTWDPPQSSGKQHRYRLRVSAEGADDAFSSEAIGYRSGPAPIGYEVIRAGAQVASLPATASSYLDDTGPPAAFLPPTSVAAGETAGGIEVRWTAPSSKATSTFEYRVRTLYSAGISDPSNAVTLGRTPGNPTGYAILRDGGERAIVPAASLAWTDTQGYLDLVDPPDVSIWSTLYAISLDFGDASTAPSGLRTYEVVALYGTERSDPVATAPVSRSAPEIVGYRVSRDDGEMWVLPAGYRSYRDDTAEPGQVFAPGSFAASQGTYADRVHLTWTPVIAAPGPTYVYSVRVMVAAGDGPATELEGARTAPDLEGTIYDVHRDGEWIGWLYEEDDAEFDDIGATLGPSTAPVLSATADRADGVALAWTGAVLAEGVHHTYELVAHVPRYAPWTTAPVTGFLGTDFDGYEVVRDGEGIAALPLGATSYLDEEALSVGAPGGLTASTIYADAVGLSWTAPSGAAFAHAYQVRVVSGALDLPSQVVSGSRAESPILGYEFSRDDGVTWHPAGNRAAYNDADAPLGTLYKTTGIDIALQYPGGVVSQKTDYLNPSFSVTQPTPSPYRVRALTAGGPGATSAVAMGRRAASASGVTAVWQRSVGDSDGPYVDVGPCCSEPASSTLDIGEARWFRLYGQSPSAAGGMGTVRLERRPFTTIAAGEKHACGLWDDGQLRCWGTYRFASSPYSRPAGHGYGPYVGLAAGGTWTYVTQASGFLQRFGGDTPYVLWLPAATPPYSMVAVGTGHACGLQATDDRVVCTGTAPPSDFFASITAGDGYSCGILLDGTISCWGAAPAGIPTGTFSEIAAGYDHVCGITTAGSLECWGNPLATSPPPGTDWAAVRAGDKRSCAMRSDGTVACWGQSMSWTIPAGAFVGLTMGRSFACGLDADGAVDCWGTAP